MANSNSNIIDLVLDNDILIKNIHGSLGEKERIQEIFKNNHKCVLNLTFAEFKRTILKDLVIFFNDLVDFVKEKRIESNDLSLQIMYLNDFLLGYKKNYGLNAKGRFISYIIMIFNNIINHLINLASVSPFEITLDLIKNQIFDYRNVYFYDTKTMEDSLNCPHIEIEPIKEENKFAVPSFSCKDCEKKKIPQILNKFHKDFKSILESSISNKLINILKYIIELDNIDDLDGRKHVCLNLADLFLILNCPDNHTIFTSNYSHFNEFCDLLEISIIFLK